ncbi:HD-GYP domain-containing protein [Oceanospirillum sanctuarii]|uniref:HD-GYP domain-containing protein n=1 Tax=Oceanospirillum sanctuarii TaxID=1434821 RepID=UPI000A371211|nr:HD-GYP domain-containing protein [Oceanospirillum sanctuarii]
MRQNIPVTQLMPGMKIVALDIGWTKSPKWTNPFVLNSGEDLALLLQHCKIVAIETNQAANEQAPEATAPSETTPKPAQAGAQPKKQPATSNASLEQRISKQFVIDSFHECMDILTANFDRVRNGQRIDANSIQATSKKLLISTIARPGTLALLSQLEEKDSSLERKSQDVAILSLNFGRSLGMSKAQLHKLCMSALLHDIGMIKIPAELLEQKETLSIGQRISIQKHVNYGCDILHQSSALRPLNSVIAYHHERFDGTGYPSGISGRKIPLEARILAITTAFEAMTRNRHFSNKETPTQALRKIYSLRNQNFDGKLVERFIRSVGVYPVGTLVELNKQQIGMVTDVAQATRSRPKVRCLFNHQGHPLPKQRDLDLAGGPFKKVKITRTVEPEEIEAFSLQSLAQDLGFSRVA